ncbi:MAG: methylated-DNA--[protein]-cysteine S-methyltransferase [Streptosporangiaceae bacterium]
MISTKGTPRLSSTMIDSPLGPLMLVAGDGALAGLYLNERAPAKVLAAIDADSKAGGAVFAEAARQLDEYFDGRRQAFGLPLALDGTAFQRTVWDALLGIGYGETVSYGELADRIGRPTASRAVGLANGRNPVSIIVPCHRVVGSDGSLTGYGGGIGNKRHLLDLEQRVTGACLPG